MNRALGLSLLLVLLAVCTGCPSQPTGGDTRLQDGYAALERSQSTEAQRIADEVLRDGVQGQEKVRALYLRGRAAEERPKVDSAMVTRDFAEAKGYYVKALGEAPSRAMEGSIRASLGNLAFFQDNYAEAIGHLKLACDRIENRESLMWAMYRLGLCQQREAMFADADATYDSLRRRFPGTPASERALEHRGAQGFYVYLGEYDSQNAAIAAIASLRSEGFLGVLTTNRQGQYNVRLGTYAKYAQAMDVRRRLAAKYPRVTVFP